ncbi:MAG: hypothetical protein AAF411_23110 [Myxococcota bacterium]
MLNTAKAAAQASVILLGLLSAGCGSVQPEQLNEGSAMSIHYLEIVTENVDEVCGLYETAHGLYFGPETAAMGQARLATRPDGSMVGVRRPLAEHEQPIVRTYVAVEDIDQAVRAAEAAGAMTAYPPTAQGDYGSFAIVIQGDVQHGLWQRP